MDGEQSSLLKKGRLPSNWLAQTCELHALKQALELLRGEKGTIDIDSKYAFRVIHTFGKIWKERGLISSRGKELVHERLVLEVVEALDLPEEIAVVHVMGHQKGGTLEIRGNQLAKEATIEKETQMLALTPSSKVKDIKILLFTKVEEEFLQKMGGVKTQKGRWLLPDGRQILNKSITREILIKLQGTHRGAQALYDQFLRTYCCVGVYTVAKQMTEQCLICQEMNKKVMSKTPSG